MKLCYGTFARQHTKPWTLNQTSHTTHRTARRKTTGHTHTGAPFTPLIKHIYWCFSPDQHSFSDSAAALTALFPQQNSWLHFCHENHHSQTWLLGGNNRKQPLFLYSSRITVFPRIPAAFSCWLHCLLTNNWRGFTLFSWRGTGLSPVFNFIFPAYINSCLKQFGIKTRVNRKAYSILQPWSTALRAEQTALGSNPADMSVFQTLLVSSLKSCNLAIGAERHSSKEKGSGTSYTVFWTLEHYFFTVFITNALENTKCKANS